VLGGLFNTLLAPAIFSTGIIEYPIAHVLACLLRPSVRPPERIPGRLSSEWFLMARSADSFGSLKADSRWVIPEKAARVWTDNSSDILSAVK
jgi:hypothetical protein